MPLADLVKADCIRLDVEASSKKRALEEAARQLGACPSTPEPEQIFERLLERERLGSTGLANGVALPHARMAGIDRAYGVFLRLAAPVDFDALDGQPVDLLFALLVPEEATSEHLDLLAALARLFSDKALCGELRSSSSPDAVAALISTHSNAPHAQDSASVRRPA
jgi:PTS system nitrogen regulatory IIA component